MLTIVRCARSRTGYDGSTAYHASAPLTKHYVLPGNRGGQLDDAAFGGFKIADGLDPNGIAGFGASEYVIGR